MGQANEAPHRPSLLVGIAATSNDVRFSNGRSKLLGDRSYSLHEHARHDILGQNEWCEQVESFE